MKQLATKLSLACLVLAGASGIALAQPVITNAPYSTLGYLNSNVMFFCGASDTASNAMSYQWEAGSVGSGSYTNLLPGGQYGGVTSNTLVITNVQLANQADYVCVVTAADGTTPSGPATLTVLPLIYINLCQSPAASLNVNESTRVDGWLSDITYPLLGDTRLIAQAVDGANTMALEAATGAPWFGCYKSWDGSNEAFYTTCTLQPGYNPNGVYEPPLVSIPIATAQNLTFVVDIGAIDSYGNTEATDYLMVQVNGGTNWYVSTTAFPYPPNGGFQQFSLAFNPTAADWQEESISGYGSVDNTNYPSAPGSAPAANLSGNITGFGVLCVPVTAGTQYAHYFANFAIAGNLTYPTLPVINAQPANLTANAGDNASFSVNATTNNIVTGLSYQWYAQSGGTGPFSALSNGGQYSGATSYQLTVASTTAANSNETFEVVVTDGAGSVTSSPPAVLTVVAAPPTLSQDISDYPPAPGSYVGSAPMPLNALFIGSLPITYYWQFTTDTNAGPIVTIAVTTNNGTYSLPLVSTNQTGYYQVIGSNAVAPYVAYSSWLPFSVLPASQRLITWQAPVVMGIEGQTNTYLTCEQILDDQQGAFYEAEEVSSGPNNSGLGGENVVTKNGNRYFFDNQSLSAAISGGYGSFDTYYWGIGTYLGATPYTSPVTSPSGNTSLDEVLCSFQFDGYAHQWAIQNLIPGVEFSVQLFGLDSRSDSSEYLRSSDYQALSNNYDVSEAFTMGGVTGDCYVIGTFVATNETMNIQQNFWTYGGAGNSQAVVVRVAPPTLSISPSGVLTWPYGGLLQSTNVSGPWTTNTATSPYQAPMTGQQMFYRLEYSFPPP